MKIIEFEIDENLMLTGMTQLANLSRLEVCHENEDIFEVLDFDDERVFLEPTLIFHQARKGREGVSLPLEQLLWGAVPAEERPLQVRVQTCAEGWVKLPGWGNLKTELASAALNLSGTTPDDLQLFTLQGNRVPAQFYPEVFLPNSSIRVTRYRPDIYRCLGAHLHENVTTTFTKWVRPLQNAFSIIQQAVPEYCQLIAKSSQEISLFSSDNQNSFAAMEHFGTGFINVDDQGYDEVFFVDDIAHQCGHTIFNALTLMTSHYLSIDPNTTLVSLVDDAVHGEHRTVYGAFHGLFTYTSTLHCLDQSLKKGLFKGQQVKDVIGRIGFYMRKFNYDLKQLSRPGVFTDHGLKYYAMFKASYESVLNKYRVLPPVTYVGQPYTFRLEMFINANPEYKLINEDALVIYGL
ncbi:hypothetical protein E5K00_14325 [Hymenobacter aquaticus]|uniref:Uncharacterized protein n=1 Tax=Hymenobacter aquaticus TaxID=1867101 RepID=A0A4Z0PVW5_9BACT|nr:hypothetical protein [Hymenobacter aquaticus]TGE21459.1 hypothetical protein E5K00_14325 [Hymenobacter aquaticus]